MLAALFLAGDKTVFQLVEIKVKNILQERTEYVMLTNRK